MYYKSTYNQRQLVPAHPGSPGKRAVKRVCVCCVYVRCSCFAGTAFSGYAFSFTHESAASSSPSSRSSSGYSGSVHMMGKWDGSDPGIIQQKTPSTILLTPDAQFHSFGFAARNFYHDLSTDDARTWLYFDKFKMRLYQLAVKKNNSGVIRVIGRCPEEEAMMCAPPHFAGGRAHGA